MTRALDTRAFYVCPRINPDGAEWALADKPKWVRSSTRPVSVRRGGDRGAHRRGHRRRRPHPADAHPRSQRALEGPSASSRGSWSGAIPIETGGTLLPDPARGHGRGLGRLHVAREEDRSRGSISTAIFRRAGGRNSSSSAPGRSRRRSRKCARSSRSSSAIRTSPAASPFHTWSGVLLRPFEHLPDDEMHAEDLWHYQKVGRQGHRAHRLSGDLRLPRVPLSPEAGDRRRVRLDLRAPRHVQLGGRDLEPDARSGHRELQVHRLVPRPSDRGRPQALPLERRQARRRRAHRVEAVRPSAARPDRDRRLEPLPRVLAIRRRRSSSARSRASRSGCSGRR